MTTVHPSITPPLHPWDVQIDNHLFLGKLACFSDNFTTVESLLATAVEGAVDYTADLTAHDRGKNTKVVDTIKGYNTACVATGQTVYNNFAQKVGALKTTEVDEKAWSESIDDAAAEAKAAAVKAIDQASKAAKGFISKLPAGTRNSAARLFVAGTKVVLNFFATVWDKIKIVLDSIGQFLKNTWKNLTSALGAVIAAAKLAVSYITGGKIAMQTIGSVNMELVNMLEFQQNPRVFDIRIPDPEDD